MFIVLNYVAQPRVPGRTQSTPHPPFWNLIITPRPHPRMPPFFSFWGLGKIFWAIFLGRISNADRAAGPPLDVGERPTTREAAMAAFGKSWRRES